MEYPSYPNSSETNEKLRNNHSANINELLLTNTIRKYVIIVNNISEQIDHINDFRKENTGIIGGMGDWIGEKTGAYETGKGIYEKQLEQIQKQVEIIRSQILSELSGRTLSVSEKTSIDTLILKLEKVSGMKLDPISWADATLTSIGGANTPTKYIIRASMGAAEGTYEGIAGIMEITGKAIGILAAYTIEPRARDIIKKDISEIFSQLTLENAKKLLVALPKVFEEFQKLPADKQVEGATKLIAMILVPLGIGVKTVKAGNAIAETGFATVKNGVDKTTRAANILTKQAQRTTGPSKNAMRIAANAGVAGAVSIAIGTGGIASAEAAIIGGTAIRYIGEMGGGKGKIPTKITEEITITKKVTKPETGSDIFHETVIGNENNPNREIEQAKKRTKVEKSTDLPAAIKLNEDIANEAKIRGVDEKIIRKERLIKNEGLSPEQAERVITAHTIGLESEGLGKYGITSLKEKIKTMIEGAGGLTIDQARNMLKKGYAGVLEDTQGLLQEINRKGGTDFLESKLAGKNINQAELNALVSQFIANEGADIAKLDDTIRTIFEISGYAGDKTKMYAEAIKFAKDLKINELVKDIKNIIANDIFKHISTEGLEASENLVTAFLKDGSKDAKLTFLKSLETNDSLRNNILTGKLGGDFIKVLGENYTTQNKLITNIIGDEKLLKTLSSETLKGLDSILSKMMQENIITGGFADTLKTKLALARNANSPANKVAYFLQNGDEKIAELLRATSTEKNVWNTLFNELRSVDNGVIQQLNMIKRGEPSFFNMNDLGNFFNMNFWDLEKGVQKEFIKTYITPTDGKYHTVLEEFPGFKGKLEEYGFI